VNVLFVASEVAPFAKTGGLGDVAAALPRALAAHNSGHVGHDVRVVMPMYGRIKGVEKAELVIREVNLDLGGNRVVFSVYATVLPGTTVPIYLVSCPGLYGRRGIYTTDHDEHLRFALLSWAALVICQRLGFRPDIVHANDWQTGLVPVYLQEVFKARSGWERTRSIYTIHNIAYQGMFGAEVMRLTGLPGWLFNHKQLEFHGQFNFLKSGIVFADAVNTVSPTYAREIQTAEFGCGLEGLLGEQKQKLSGIMNGIDTDAWNPAADPHLTAPYDVETVFEQKPVNKAELQRRFKLPVDTDKPVLGMVARLVSQKGIDLVLGAAPGFLDLGCQMIFLGEGDPEYHNQLDAFQKRHPQQVGLYLGYSDALAHLIEAGSDLFLMPSRYEPSGLNQLYSMKYGTPPVVRGTGGLADSVRGANEETLADGTATGFTFGQYSADALYQTVNWALTLYRKRPADFRQVVRTAMTQDWSWSRSAGEYEALYRRVRGL